MYNYSNSHIPNDPNASNRPPMPPPPGGQYQQGGPPHGSSPYQQHGAPQQQQPYGYGAGQNQYGQPSPPMHPPDTPGMLYGPGASGGHDVGGLAAGMGGMHLGGTGTEQHVAAHGKKKKARAYHTVDSTSAMGTMDVPPAAGFVPGPPMLPHDAGSGFVTPGLQGQVSPGFGQPQFSAPALSPYVPSSGFQAPTGLSAPSGGQLGEYSAAIHPPTGSGPGAQHRVDPDAIPSIPEARESAQKYADSQIYPTLERHHPPPATTDFMAHDQGNSSPKFARMTLNNVPANTELLAQTGLPLSLILTPLAAQKPEEGPVPVLDFGDTGPPRCRRCRTYINPFMQFTGSGAKFVCNMCLFPNNEVSPEYYQPIDAQGRRIDRDSRPELSRGTVEFVVPKEYWAKPPTPLRYLFLIETGKEAIDKGWTHVVAKSIKAALYDGVEEEEGEPDENGESTTQIKGRKLPKGCRIGIVTFDKDIGFYNLSPKLDTAQLMMMTDLEEPFVPLEDGLFVDPYESRTQIEALLDLLPTLHEHTRVHETAILPVLTAAVSALEATGGRIMCCMTTLPTLKVHGSLVMRDDPNTHAGEKERQLFKTDNPTYIALAKKLVDSGIGIDMMLGPSTYIDVATLGHLSATSGGDTFFFPNFVATRDGPKVEKEFAHAITRENGFQALMKVRCSNGLQVNSYHGNFLQKTFQGDLEMGVIDADKSVSVMFTYDGKLDPKLDAHFQSALLYTTASGERRVRVQNIVAAVTEVGREVLRFVDQEAVVSIIAKEAANKMVDRNLKDIRQSITDKCIEILANYRKHFSTGTPPGQLVLPEGLKEFAMYMLSLIKCRAFRAGPISSDMRTHAMRLIKQMPPSELLSYLYPRILPIHSLEPEQGFPDATTGLLSIPTQVRASFSRIEEGGAYLVDNGQTCLLWLHAHVSPNLLEDLFGEGKQTLQALDPFAPEIIPVLETHLNAQTRNLVRWMEERRAGRKITIMLARQGLDGSEFEFAGLLVEDRNNEAQSYVDWLVAIHRNVQLEVSGQRKKDDHSDDLSGLTGLRPAYW
ncbi:COPII coat Sec23p-Sfb3p heterodimer component [Orbilia oligospora]|uniref:COPII coat Sec23p-Sfb3p heterodimer component n=1 Tax=Orbilia oligospora TaxID=2813651 RepID=A0A7C8P914_ORBOL|nr:COPII coat Sec23p-Sfb3p heterodimer component [Orbilia oligospora]KAF3136950.1 COPII coat Sec23p-Sfb3p heterodimer component [Orbilia oligospora]